MTLRFIKNMDFLYLVIALSVMVSGDLSFVPPCNQLDVRNLTLPKCYTCEGFCGLTLDQVAPRSREKGRRKIGRQEDGTKEDGCSCDHLCPYYRDCCHGFEQACPEDLRRWISLKTSRLPDHPTCVTLATPGKAKVFSLVTSCPGEEQVCMRTSENANRFIPVYDNGTGLHYVNFKCASYNGVRMTNVVPWHVHLACRRLRYQLTTYNETVDNKTVAIKELKEVSRATLLQEVLNTKTLSTADCALEFTPPKSGGHLRYCRNGFHRVIGTCPDTCRNVELAKMCIGSYVEYVHVKTETPQSVRLVEYKNPYCAYCNEIVGTSLKCGLLFPRHREEGHGGASVSFPALFDFDPRNGFTLGQSQNTKPSCPSGQHWAHGQCRQNLQLTPLKQPAPMLRHAEPLQLVSHIKDIIENAMNHTTIVNIRNQTKEYMDLDILLRWNNEAGDQDIKDVNQVVHELVNTTLWKYGSWSNFHLTVDVRFGDSNCTYIKFDTSEVNLLENGTLLLNTTGETISFHGLRFVNNVVFICTISNESAAPLIITPLYWLTWFLVLLSLSALCVRIYFHFLFKEFHNPVGRVQTSLAFSLFLALLSFLVSSVTPVISSGLSYHGCYFIGLFMHWAFLAMFAWTSVVSVDIMRMLWLSSRLFRMEHGSRKFLYQSIFAWLTPTLFVSLSVILNHTLTAERFQPRYGRGFCWFNQRYALLIFFVAPVSFAILINIFMLVLSVTFIIGARSNTRRVNAAEGHNIFLYLKLFVLMGVTWVLGVMAEMTKSVVMDYVFVILNASQGLLITVGSLCSTNIREAIKVKLCWKQLDGTSQTPNNTGDTSMTTRFYGPQV